MKLKDFFKILVEQGFVEGDVNVEEHDDLQVYLPFPRENSVYLDGILKLNEVAEVSFFTNRDGRTDLVIRFKPEGESAVQ